MKTEQLPRLIGLVVGFALLAAGVTEASISSSDLDSAKIAPWCRYGFCATAFSPERVFEISQRAILGDPKSELKEFTLASQLSPASAYRWADLGDAEWAMQDIAKAQYAYQQALTAGPRSPVILTRAANFYFSTGDTNRVIQQLRTLLRDPGLSDYYESAFLTYSRLGLPSSQLLNSIVPARKDTLSTLLAFWTKTQKLDEAIATWQYASTRRLIDSTSTGQFFRFLIQSGNQDQAQSLWQQYVSAFEPGYRKTNWIFNPSFEHAPFNSPFDWNIEQRQDIQVTRTQNAKNTGTWSYRIQFTGDSNTAYHQTYQDMVLPAGNYQFSCMMKTDNITSDEGIRIHIFDWPTQAKLNFWSDTLTGSHDWTQIRAQFQVPEGVRVVRVEVGRLSSNAYLSAIGGTTWIDNFELAKD